MEKTYSFKDIERKWLDNWKGKFSVSISDSNYSVSNYCIVLPPPNVTGSLHMGHGFQLAIMDALIRYHRKLDFNVHLQTGFDHAGIATQIVIEQNLAKNGIDKRQIDRDDFLKHADIWVEKYQNRILEQQKKLGISADWTKTRFTLDEKYCADVQQAFISLYKKGLIYRKKKLINWDPIMQTAVSDLEVDMKEKEGNMWYIRYDENIVIATTRPETIFGDTAVAVNPKDERYKWLIGKIVTLPIVNRRIEIIADESIDMEFGTGCVKITPAHDFNDYEIGIRHELESIQILDKEARMINVPDKYIWLDRFVARKEVIEQLKEMNLLVDIKRHVNRIPISGRSNAILEPMLMDQWFISMSEMAKKAIAIVKSGQIEFIPSNWDKTYFNWLENIQDWCISRQIWWGHRIPAWYDKDGNIYVGGTAEKETREMCNIDDSIELRQDKDVLDTWFSSSLWAYASMEENQSRFLPTNVLVTGFDIIFFWVARMIMMTDELIKKTPFEKVYVTGLIRDKDGQKMSKSKGNVLDPIDLIDGIGLEELIKKRTDNLMNEKDRKKIEKVTRKEFPNGIDGYGTDALRLTFLSLASTSRDINFDINRLKGYRNFCTKLWNVARFIDMNITTSANYIIGLSTPTFVKVGCGVCDLWIQYKLNILIEEVHKHFEIYRFDLLIQSIYDFFWHEYCDWYIEMCKLDISTNTNTKYTLYTTFIDILRILNPIAPFITEEIYDNLTVRSQSVLRECLSELADYPKKRELDKQYLMAYKEIEFVKEVVRKVRDKKNIDIDRLEILEENKNLIKFLTRSK